ncbi:MAG: hypothetical protein Q618_VCMC00003G0165 [Varibaculum cambriense DORA_20]|uniref:DUF7507 domain-containing protein n=1 Tax=Varibaculum cambriense TaxID=184870 RepID=UPI0003D61966|nr:hypothetical protein [Varibaculum cambriense]ETI81863.1 MAG: hypothetical protein Q618_VCMC00003G0165 [Varibaculum cambriense DORA_20]
MAKVKTLLAALFSAALIALSLISLAPKAQAADLNQCAGTMEDKGSSFDGSPFHNMTFPYMDLVNQEESLAIGNSAPVGSTTVKITAPKQVNAGDSYRIYGGWGDRNHVYYAGRSEFLAHENGTKNVLAKVNYISDDGEPYLRVTWTAYAASKQDAWVQIPVRQSFGFSTSRGDTVRPGMKPTVRFGLTGCDGSKTRVINKQIIFDPLGSFINAYNFEADENGYITGGNRLTFFTLEPRAYGITNVKNIMRVYVNLGKGWNFKCEDLPTETYAAYGYYIGNRNTFHHAATQATPGAVVKPASRKVRAYCDGNNPKRAFFELGYASIYDRFYVGTAIYPDGSKVDDLQKVGGKPVIKVSADIYQISADNAVWNKKGTIGPVYKHLVVNPTTGGAELPPGKLKIVKKGNGLEAGQRFLTGHSVNFTYDVTNIGERDVNSIAVLDSKGVKVTCPKAILKPGESMTCSGQGIVKAEPEK